MTLTGDNGLLTRTVGAKNKTTLAGMEEELNLVYMSVYTGKAGSGAINAGVSLDEIYADASLPSEVKSHIIQRGNVSTIRLVEGSSKSVTILAENGAITSNGTAGANTVSIQIEEGSNNNAYWLESEGVYYPMSIANGRVVLDKENASTTEPTGAGNLGNGVEVTFKDSGAAEGAETSSFVEKGTVEKNGNITTIPLTASGAGSTEVIVKNGNIGLEGGNITVTVLPVYTLNFGTMTNGDVVITTNGQETAKNAKYASGTQIVVTATVNEGYRFEKWTDNNSTTNPRPITVNNTTAEVTYTATFKTLPGHFKTVNGVAYYYPGTTDENGVEITASNMGDYLGREVKYTPGNVGSASYGTSTTYRLFYIDLGTGTNGKYGDGVGTIYLKADCDTNTANMSDHINHSSSDSRAVMKKLNPRMGAATYNDPHDNCVAWMTDPTQWSGWRDGSIKIASDNTAGSGINYVVGGPSLEMYVDSYNAYLAANSGLKKNGTTNAAEALACEYVTSGYDAKGYRIGFQAQTKRSSWANTGYYQDSNSLFAYNSANGQQMYNPGRGKRFWLASPAASASRSVMILYGDGSSVSRVDYSSDSAFCPLVSIKSGVSIEEK